MKTTKQIVDELFNKLLSDDEEESKKAAESIEIIVNNINEFIDNIQKKG